MKYACGVVGSIRNTVTRLPSFVPGFDSVPVRPSNGWPRRRHVAGIQEPEHVVEKDLFYHVERAIVRRARRFRSPSLPPPSPGTRRNLAAHPAICRKLPLDAASR